jgi:hypothetical protein
MNLYRVWLFIAVVCSVYAAVLSSINYIKAPKGICVAYDVNTVGTMVDVPKRNNGVLACEVGSYISLNP